MHLTREENRDEIRRFEHIKPAPVFGPVRCFAQLPGSHRTCTLSKEHEGPHVAHGFLKRVYAVWREPELREESVAEKPVVHPRFVAGLFTQMAQDAIKEEGPTGDVVMVLRKLDDFYSETWAFEFYALHQAAQQMAIQSDGRLLRHAVSISGQTDYDFTHSMEPSKLAEKKSKEDLEKGMVVAPEVVMSGELEEVLDVRISAYMECMNQFETGKLAASMKLFDLGPDDSLRIFTVLSELLIFYKGLLDGLTFVV